MDNERIISLEAEIDRFKHCFENTIDALKLHQ